MRYLSCGNDVHLAWRTLSDPARCVLERWLLLACRIPGIDRVLAESAIVDSYERMALPPPSIRWWKSPVAMLMAHEMAALGVAGAVSLYGTEAVAASPELEEWLRSGSQQPLGRPVGLQTCGCRGFSQRQHAWLCPRITEAVDPDVWRKRRKYVRSAFDILWPMRMPLEECGHAVGDVFRHQGTRRCDGGADRPCMRRDRPVLGTEISFFPGSYLKEMAILETTASWGDETLQESCFSPFARLVGSTHLAILREKECWLCEGPTGAHFDSLGNLHAVGRPALAYGDGTALYAFKGQLLPAEVGRWGSALPLEIVDFDPDHHVLRPAMLELYGVARYLHDHGAVLVEESVGSKLWKIDAGEVGPLHILEEASPVGNESIYGEAPADAASIAKAREYVDQVWGAVIFAPPYS